MSEHERIIFDSSLIRYRHKLDIITSGSVARMPGCSAAEKDGKTELIYDVSGCVRLSDVEEFTAEEALNIIEETVCIIHDFEEYFIFPEEYELSLKHIWYRKSDASLKAVFVPVQRAAEDGSGEKTGAYGAEAVLSGSPQSFLGFLRELKARTYDYCGCLDTVEREAACGRSSGIGLMRAIDDARKKLKDVPEPEAHDLRAAAEDCICEVSVI